MFIHIFLNKLKVLLNNKSMLFWNMIFPFILGTLFYVALGGLNDERNFNVINLGIVNNKQYEEQVLFKNVIESLSEENKNQIFSTKYKDEKELKKLLSNNKIAGYIKIDNNKPTMIVKDNGIEQTIIKGVIDEYFALTSASTNAVSYNPEIIYNGVLKELFNNKNYIKDDTQEKIDFTINYYFTLIAMTCLYASLIGIELIKDSEANLSTLGARINVSPVNKFKMLLANLLAGFLVQLFGLILLFIYLLCILKVNLGSNIPCTFIISVVGILAGLSLGMFVGVSNKKSETFKTGLLIAVIMFCCFASGMMGEIGMKAYFDETFPVFSVINPINMITDGLYSLFAYDTLTVYYNRLTRIIIFTLIFLSLSFVFIRRKKYDSI